MKPKEIENGNVKLEPLSPTCQSDKDFLEKEIEIVNNSLHLLDLGYEKNIVEGNIDIQAESADLNIIESTTSVTPHDNTIKISKINGRKIARFSSTYSDSNSNSDIDDSKEPTKKEKCDSDTNGTVSGVGYLNRNLLYPTNTEIRDSACEFQNDLKNLYSNQIDFLQEALRIEKKRNHQYEKQVSSFQKRIFDLQEKKENDKATFKKQLMKVQIKLENVNKSFVNKTLEIGEIKENFRLEKQISEKYLQEIRIDKGKIIGLEKEAQKLKEKCHLLAEELAHTKKELDQEQKDNLCLKAENNIHKEEKILLKESRERMKRDCIQAKEEMYRLDKLIYGKREGRRKGSFKVERKDVKSGTAKTFLNQAMNSICHDTDN